MQNMSNRQENSPKGLPIEGVKHRVSGTVCNGSATVSLSSLAKLERLASEGTLVLLCFAKEGGSRWSNTRERRSMANRIEDRSMPQVQVVKQGEGREGRGS
jgi:hypothetical protein